MPELTTCHHCKARVPAGARFCGQCGRPLAGSGIICPQCRAQVDQHNFCSKCGADLQPRTEGSVSSAPIWSRGEDNFAVAVPHELIRSAAQGAFEVRHSCRALLFEDGRLVQIAESGRHSVHADGILGRLFKKKKGLSAVLVDAGDLELSFSILDLKTRDKLFVEIGLNVVVRLDDPNNFFVNLMKDREAFKHLELRKMLYPEIQNALQEAAGNYAFEELNTSLALKNEIASRMESHLRQTFGRSGLGFGQIRSLSVVQQELDAAAREAAQTETEARGIEGETVGKKRKAEAQRTRDEVDRDIRGGKIADDRKDADLDAEEKDAGLYRKQRLGEKDIQEQFLDADFLKKRIEVYKRLKEADVEQIKTEEDFRKFRQEVDRDKVLDEAEWQSFQDEILWKEEDRRRDRRFLVRKIELQQEHDEQLMELTQRSDLDLEAKKREMQLLDLELEGELNREMKRIQGLADIERTRAEAKMNADQVVKLGEKETEIQSAIKELDLEKQKAETRAEIEKKELEIKKMKSELGMANLEKVKAVKREDEYERMLMQEEQQQKDLERRLREEAEKHRRELERSRSDAEIERERFKAMSELSIEQLISVSGVDQSRILGDLAQSQTLKGMGADEIAAMQDPAAFAKALEERARNSQSDELKQIYERMITQNESAMDRIARAYQDGSDRAERMHLESMRAMSGQQEHNLQTERGTTDRLERAYQGSLDKMGDVATARAGAGGRSDSGGGAARVQICGNCKNEVPSGENFCPNCGERLY